MTDAAVPLPASLRRLTRPSASQTFRLFCFPYAGAGASMYRPWVAALPAEVDLYAIQLPGREDRIREPPMLDFDAVTAMLAADIAPLTDRPYGFFGHSLGAVLSAEVARSLTLQHRTPAHLVVSGCRALNVIERHRLAVHELSDEDLIAHIRTLNGTPEAILEDPGMRAVILRLVRADYALYDQYVHATGWPLPCSITVFGGDADPSTSPESLAAWAELTSGASDVHMFPGDHFFAVSARTDVVDTLVGRLLENGAAGIA